MCQNTAVLVFTNEGEGISDDENLENEQSDYSEDLMLGIFKKCLQAKHVVF